MATFFERQVAARRNTRVMVLLYALAVSGVVLAVEAVIAGLWAWQAAQAESSDGARRGIVQGLMSVPAELMVAGALGTLALILGVSIFQVVRLRQGGDAIAAMMGARLVPGNSRDPLERRLLNVVEEMAIASGVRVPGVYVLDGEPGINAFAAGYDASNAIVAVTRGTLETLNRDELQGVIGHEFSHILNGDMWLNIRMLGVLAGIVFIGAIGSFLVRSVRGGGRNSGGIVAFGIALFIIGYVGLFFARLIKASVSREREFLADASGVQFTRNPDGLAGALDQIDASGRGTVIAGRYAEDLSHMFFARSFTTWFAGLFDTHPPIGERIRRVSPGFQRAGYLKLRAAPDAAPAELPAEHVAIVAALSGAVEGPAGRAADRTNAWGRSAAQSAALVGELDGGKVAWARRLLDSLPGAMRDRLHVPEGAGAAVIALMLAPREAVIAEQLAAARGAGDVRLADAARSMLPALKNLGVAYHLPVIDLALPALRSASAETKAQFMKTLEAVINADRRVSLHEFIVLAFMRAQIAPPAKPVAPGFRALDSVRDDALRLLSLVARAGQRRGLEAEGAVAAAFAAGAAEMGLADAALLPFDALNAGNVDTALRTLRDLAPMPRALLVQGLFAAATADGTIRVVEAELLRMVGAALDCPLPPLMEDLDPARLAA